MQPGHESGVKALDFESLPLRFVHLEVQFDSPLLLSPDRVTEFCALVRSADGEVLRLKSISTAGFAFSLNDEPGVLFRIPSSEVVGEFAANGFAIRWESGQIPYPRFEPLLRIFKHLLPTDLTAARALLKYRIEQPMLGQDHWSDWVQVPDTSSSFYDGLNQLTVEYKVNAFQNWALTCGTAGSNFLIETNTSTDQSETTDSAEELLASSHVISTQQFLKCLTHTGRTRWGIKSNG